MHNSMCGWKLACLLCNCQSDYRRRTGKKTNVSFNKWGHWQWGHWNGPLASIMIDSRESPSRILSSKEKFRTSRETHILSFSMKLARETHILASNLQRHQ